MTVLLSAVSQLDSVVEEEKKKKKTRSLPSPLLCPTPGKCVETDIYLLSKQGKRVYSDIFVSKTRGGDASLLPDAAKKSISQVFFFFFNNNFDTCRIIYLFFFFPIQIN